MLEKEIEAKCRKLAKARGWFLIKWVAPGFSGVPDRILLRSDGKIDLIEFKTPKGKVSKLQSIVHARFGALGHKVHVIRSVEDFTDTFLDPTA